MKASRSLPSLAVAPFAGALAVILAAAPAPADLLISQYYEGTPGTNKYIELFNSGAIDIDLSLYFMGLFSNESREGWKIGTAPADLQQYQLPAKTLAPGQNFLLKHSLCTIPGDAAANANASADGLIKFNGDDSVVLYLGNTWAINSIRDAFSVTPTPANQAADKSFYRLSNDVGYDTVAGTSSVVDYASVWAVKTLAEVAAAVPADPWYLDFQPAVLPPVLDGFTLSADAADAVSPLVGLTVTASGAPPTEYRVSESNTFAGAVWLAYAPSPAPRYELSAGLGAKTVYFQLRNANGESAALSDSINRIEYTYAPTVVISQYYEGSNNNKYIELSNLTNDTVSLDSWTLARWSNGATEGWKTSGPGGASIPLTGRSLGPLGTLVIAHDLAVSPVLNPPASVVTEDLSFNGDDSVTLHNSTLIDPSTLVDAVSILSTGDPTGAGVGKDTSFVRISTAQGFGFSLGSDLTQFPSVWQQVSTSDVDAATNDQNIYLGTYPGTIVPLSGYELWAAGYVGLGDRTSDDDGDGLANVAEYAMGSDPKVAGIPYAVTLNGSGKPRLVIPKGTIAAADPKLSYESEVSSTLAAGSWGSAGTTVTDSATQFIIDYTGSSTTAFLRFKAVLTP